MKDQYFSYDCETGFCTHRTREKAIQSARDMLAYWASEAAGDGEWPEEAGSVCWGEIKAQIEIVDCEDGTVDYRLTEERGTDGT